MTDPLSAHPWTRRLRSLASGAGRFLVTPGGAATALGGFAGLVFLGVLWFGGDTARTFTADVFRAVAWPVAILLVAFLVCPQLVSLSDRVKRIPHGPFEIALDESFRRLQEQTAPILEEAPSETATQRLESLLDDLGPAPSPRQGVLDAWGILERSLRDLVWARTRTQPPRTFRGLETRIREDHLLPDCVCDAVETLRVVFRAARRALEAQIPQEHVDLYQRSVLLVVSAVNAEIQRAREPREGS